MRPRFCLYSVLLIVAITILICLQIISPRGLKPTIRHVLSPSQIISKLEVQGRTYLANRKQDGRLLSARKAAVVKPFTCRMDSCFDYSKCGGLFKVYIYPEKPSSTISQAYRNMLNSIQQSQYITDDPTLACVFIPSLDTLDRDRGSTNYVHNLQSDLHNLPYWNGGRNHIIFNLYSGTWPDYSEHIDIDIGYAFLAKSSVSAHHFRTGFDISLPLFHNTLPMRSGEPGALTNLNTPSTRKYTIAFKGKRYLTGVGSLSRNAIHHVHNGEDIIMLTTCKHGKGWEKYADERCAIDNQQYDQYDYQQLLATSTFCLVPRGRRLGSFRFLEVLQYGCIPMILSDNWVLPFSEVIDWKQAAIRPDERLLFQLPYLVKAVTFKRISELQQQSQLLWKRYFSSLDKIVLTTLEIVQSRVKPHLSSPLSVWNSHPSLKYLPSNYSRDLTQFPFYRKLSLSNGFTAVIMVTSRVSHSLHKLMDNLVRTKHLVKVYIYVIGDSKDIYSHIRHQIDQIKYSKPISIQLVPNLLEIFNSVDMFPTEGVVLLQPHRNSHILTEEIDFIYSTWLEFPSQLVGVVSRSHLYHDGEQRYYYSSKLTNTYSIVLADGAILDKYYLYQYVQLRNIWPDSDKLNKCLDIILNFLVADISNLPPIKCGPRLQFNDSNPSQTHSSLLLHNECMKYSNDMYGYLPLINSDTRFDPALFKDQVSVARKQYLQMESVV